MKAIFKETNIKLETIEDLGTFCADTISPDNWGIHAEVIIYRGDDIGHKDGILQGISIIIMGAEEYSALEDYINALLEIYTDHDHQPVVGVNISGYTTTV